MKEEKFKIWLLKKYQQNTANSRWSNCQTVESYEGDLDNHFDLDKCGHLINKLTYSTKDQRENKPARHNIPINGDVRNGTATLKQAVRLYVDFRNGVEPTKVSQSSVFNIFKPVLRKLKQDWPEWPAPSDDDLYELVKLTARFAKFLNPDIVNALMEDNNKNWSIWRAHFKLHHINPDIYLWHRSPCAFPGVRRYSGSKEIAYFRKHTDLEGEGIPDAFQLDDNDYPKHLWSFVFRGKPFPKYGPKGYSLAHLADHKDHKNRMYQEFEMDESKEVIPIYGLYTAPTNTAFLPRSLIRPSDFSPIIRKILIERANDLYGSFCNILPPNIHLKEDKLNKWHHSNFEWADPVGSLDNMELFLEYRRNKMASFLSRG